MAKKPLLFKGLLFLLLFSISSHLYSQKFDILILNSYHKGLSWSDDVISGIENKFKKSFREDEYDVFIEYMDAKRYDDKRMQRIHYEYLKNKYSGDQFDLIIVNDDYAFKFLNEYKDELFIKTPVVFTGVNITTQYPSGCTGIREDIDLEANLNLIQKLQPGLKRLYIVSDNTMISKVHNRKINDILNQKTYEFNCQFVNGSSFHDVINTVRQLKTGDAVFLGVFTQDREGTYYSFKEVIQRINNVLDVPIFSAWDFYMDHGIVGGKIIEGFKYGEEAAGIACNILKGENVNDIRVQNVKSNYIFDYNQIRKHNISLNKLPRDSIVLNSPYSLLRENKALFIAIFVFIILLLVIIVILLRYNRMRRLRLRDQEEYLKKITRINKDLEMAKEEAQESNRLKTSFLANISHEIRTPLNAIIGFSRLISDQRSISGENYEKYYKLLKVNSNLLLNVINDIIDLSKIETNQLNLDYQDFDLNELMDSMYEYAKEERDKVDKSELDIQLDKGIRKNNFFIRSDDSRLRQVLMNLIHNAIKFTYSGKINIGYRINGEFILFYIEDTGIGLNNYEYSYIFESFRQGEEGTTKKYGGAGLGLTLARGIVENLNGSIWAESNQDKGSIFKFQIPLIHSTKNKTEKNGDLEDEMEDKYNWQGKKILVVEDSNMAYELITKLLKGTGAEFTLEVDGYKAIERCSNDNSIDIVLMDIQLPFLDGYEATRQIKKIRPNLPVIAQTANAMLEDKRKAMEVGCEDYIAKPLDRIELADKINNLLFKVRR